MRNELTYRPSNILTNFFNADFDNWFENFLTNKLEYMFKKDKEGNRFVEIEVPGFNSDNLEVTLDKGHLTVFGDNDDGKKLNKTLFLGNGIRDVKAYVKDGLLKIYLETEKNDSKKISIEQE
jgi:HSP20 family molecular chaperone IbpA